MTGVRYWQAINRALDEELARDERVCVLGEDVASPGGPFGATRGLLDRFGPKRIIDTPISEAGIVGSALGAAMNGLRPVVEVMFLDFATLTMDQLVNQAAKVSWMSGGAFHAPMTVRMVCGARRGTGPQHGQSLEAWLAHVPGLKVVWSSTPSDAYGLLKAAVRDDDPVVVIESLALWGKREPLTGLTELPVLSRARIARQGRDVTLVSWGSTVPVCLAAATTLAEEGIEAEVVDLRSLNPIDQDTLLTSLGRTRRLVVVHDAVEPCGVGAEVAAIASGPGFAWLEAPVRRVTSPFAPVPFSAHLEQAYFPGADDVASTARDLLHQRSEGP